VYDEGNQLAEDFLRGTNGLMGEDTEFVRRLASNRYKACFTPNARVRHIIHKRQTSWSWIHKRLFRHGHTLFFLLDARPGNQGGRNSFTFPWRRLRSAPASFLRLLFAAIRLDMMDAFKQSHGLAYDLGALAEAFRLRWQGTLRRE
jgi:GT2 family glycosyltransferase